jgi:hypothetical protein
MERFTLHHILSREKTDAGVNYGRIDAGKCQQLAKLVSFTKADETFICGPEIHDLFGEELAGGAGHGQEEDTL